MDAPEHLVLLLGSWKTHHKLPFSSQFEALKRKTASDRSFWSLQFFSPKLIGVSIWLENDPLKWLTKIWRIILFSYKPPLSRFLGFRRGGGCGKSRSVWRRRRAFSFEYIYLYYVSWPVMSFWQWWYLKNILYYSLKFTKEEKKINCLCKLL